MPKPPFTPRRASIERNDHAERDEVMSTAFASNKNNRQPSIHRSILTCEPGCETILYRVLAKSLSHTMVRAKLSFDDQVPRLITHQRWVSLGAATGRSSERISANAIPTN